MSAFTLKLIALVTMIIDHVGAIFFPQFIWLRYIGRLSMPIYAFLLVQGYMHTRNFNRYALRMGIFALLSEVPYDLLFQGTWLEFQRQNILFTFLTALFVMKLLDTSAKSRNIFMFIGAVILTILPYFLHFSYGVYGVLTVLCFYLFQKYRGIDAVAFAALTYGQYAQDGNTTQLYAIAAAIPCCSITASAARFRSNIFSTSAIRHICYCFTPSIMCLQIIYCHFKWNRV